MSLFEFSTGPEVCETVYESQCETTFEEHEVMEDKPECQTMQVKIIINEQRIIKIIIIYIL